MGKLDFLYSHRLVACRLCRAPTLSLALQLPETPPANGFTKTREEALALAKFPLEVMRCNSCGHHQLSAVVNPSLLFSNYVYASGTSKVFREHFAEYATVVRKRVPEGRVALEIGSNDGTFLKALREQSFTVLGVEPATGLAEKANAEGLTTMNRFFDAGTALAVRSANGPVDVWTANNVLAHIGDFVGTLQALHHCSSPRTVGVFEVQYLGSLLEMGAFDMVYHEHLDYWRLTELVDWLPKTTGWEVFTVEKVPTHGGSLRVWVLPVGNVIRGPQGFSVDSLLAEEAKRDWAHEMDTGLLGKINRARSALHEVLPDGGKGTVAYGAPAKLCTLVETLNLASRIEYVVDDSPLKQGLYTPGSGLEVVASSEMLAPELYPERILITAWNFADSIVPMLREKGFKCPIIVPFPEVKVLESTPFESESRYG